jgi:phosphatidate cytidylyltransferase
MGAYVGGRALRGRPLRADLNPRKHLPGAMSGLVAAMLAVIGLDRLLGGVLHRAELATLALVIGIFGQAGDLFESLMKRQAGARHSGHVLAEQGGLLDSVDGLLFTVPAAYACLGAARLALQLPRG